VVIDGGSFTGTISSGGIEVIEVVSAGSTVSSETITSGLNQTVLSEANTVSINVTFDGEQDISGGSTTGTSISSGGIQYVYSGTASGTVISNGGYQDVFDATNIATVSSGGIQIVESGATANSTTVLSGGEIVVYSGATVSNLVLSSGATELLLSSGGIFPAGAFVKDAAPAEVTVAHLIQAMASFDVGSDGHGAVFESVSGGGFHEDSAALAADHHRLTHH